MEKATMVVPNEELISHMIKDIGIEDEEVAQASSAFARQVITEEPSTDPDAVEMHLVGYHHGYEDALKAHGLR